MLLTGTWIITASGKPRLVEELREGDLVLTLDRGPKAVRAISRSFGMWPTFRYEPEGLNRSGDDTVSPLYLSASHLVLRQRFDGDSGVLIAAHDLALERRDLCRRVSDAPGPWFALRFDEPELICADSWHVDGGWSLNAARPVVPTLGEEAA